MFYFRFGSMFQPIQIMKRWKFWSGCYSAHLTICSDGLTSSIFYIHGTHKSPSLSLEKSPPFVVSLLFPCPLCTVYFLLTLSFVSSYSFESSDSRGIVMHWILSSCDEEQGCRKIDKLSPYWDFSSGFYIKENPAHQDLKVNFLLTCLLCVTFSKECLTPLFPCPQLSCTVKDPFPNLDMG